MSRIVQYEIVSAGSSGSLARKVNEMLQEGWQPHGSPFTDLGSVLQTLVRTSEESKRIRKTSVD